MKRIKKKFTISSLLLTSEGLLDMRDTRKEDLEMMRTIISRTSNNTPIVMIGDCEEPTGKNNGLINLKERFKNINSTEVKKDEKN